MPDPLPQKSESVALWLCRRFRMHAKVLSTSRAIKELPDLKRYRLVIIDESHNLRNRRAGSGQFRSTLTKMRACAFVPLCYALQQDLSGPFHQLRLFVPEDRDLGTRPERYLKELGEAEFIRRHQAGTHPGSL